MALDPELKAMMLDVVTLEPSLGVNRYNDREYGDPIQVQCQISTMNQESLDKNGRELISTAQIILAQPELPITVDWRVTLPDGTKPAIIQVLAAKDDVGPYYLEVRV